MQSETHSAGPLGLSRLSVYGYRVHIIRSSMPQSVLDQVSIVCVKAAHKMEETFTYRL